MDLARATALSKALARAGFIALGGFHPTREDRVPDCDFNAPHPAQSRRPLQQGEVKARDDNHRVNHQAQTLLLIGSAGSSLFEAYRASAESADGKPDPLDRYTARLLRDIAGEFGFTPAFPFDGPPWHPFQQWALKAGGFSRSPMGVLAHAIYGPWAGFRAAFLSSERFGTFEANGTAGPCETCADKPCLSACPVDAISLDGGYDVPRCRDHLRQNPQADCFKGCLARRACPFGAEFRQMPEQAEFHMKAFAGVKS